MSTRNSNEDWDRISAELARLPKPSSKPPVQETPEQVWKRQHPFCPMCHERMMGSVDGTEKGAPACTNVQCHDIFQATMRRINKQTRLEIRGAKLTGAKDFLWQ